MSSDPVLKKQIQFHSQENVRVPRTNTLQGNLWGFPTHKNRHTQRCTRINASLSHNKNPAGVHG